MVAKDGIIANATLGRSVLFTVVAIHGGYRRGAGGAFELERGGHVWDTHRVSIIEIDQEGYSVEVIPAEY